MVTIGNFFRDDNSKMVLCEMSILLEMHAKMYRGGMTMIFGM